MYTSKSRTVQAPIQPLYLPRQDVRSLLAQLGPSLGFWRAAEIAALRQVLVEPPILDVGCGDGIVTSYVLPHVDIGVDLHEGPLAHARSLGLYDSLAAQPVQNLPLPAGSMGTVLSNSVLEHIPELDEVLQTIGRLLRSGGLFVFTTPTEAFSRELLLPSARYAAWRNGQLEHLNLLTEDEWCRRLTRVGLEVVATRSYLRPSLVRLWDALELAQQIKVGDQRLFSALWRRLPPEALDRLAGWVAGIDLSSPPPGGGRLIVARKR